MCKGARHVLESVARFLHTAAHPVQRHGMNKKYSEELLRYPAQNSEGKPREILERITWGRAVLADGSLGEPELVNRRYDLQTGERLNRLSDEEFADDETGEVIRLQR